MPTPKTAKFRGREIEIPDWKRYPDEEDLPDWVGISMDDDDYFDDEALAKKIAEHYGIPNHEQIAELLVRRGYWVPHFFRAYVKSANHFNSKYFTELEESQQQFAIEDMYSDRYYWEISLRYMKKIFGDIEQCGPYSTKEENDKINQAIRAIPVEKIAAKALDEDPYESDIILDV